MAENTTNYQCPACTGPLRFDSASGKLCCDYCGSTYDVAQVEALYGEKQAQADKAAEAAEKAASSGPVWGEMETGDLSSRTCTSCGAELVCGPETAATTCPTAATPPCWADSFPASSSRSTSSPSGWTKRPPSRI